MKKRKGILEDLKKYKNDNFQMKRKVELLFEELSDFFSKYDKFNRLNTQYFQIFLLLSDSEIYYTYEDIIEITYINEKALKVFVSDLNCFITNLLKE